MQRDHPDRPVVGVVVLRGGSVLLIRRRQAPRVGLEAYNLWDETRRVIELAATRRPR